MQLVAPAGSFSALKAAVTAGADAVYLGLPHFGARAKAENFACETLKSAVDYAHLFGTKVFVTLNTLIKDCEMQDALDIAAFAYDCGVDAAIVQDIRFIDRLSSRVPNLVLHGSTQMGVHNEQGAQALLDLGIKRAVLSRETLPQDIRRIKNTGIEIEFFVQGALCVCFSGNCYFSSIASSYSGNRGKCMQLCRKRYDFGGKRGYFLSAKDLCLYDKLSVLKESGVDAVKIEGRMRSDEYVYQSVSVYKSQMPSSQAVDELKRGFNRGDYCSAYIDDGAQFRVIYPKFQANIGKFVGEIPLNRKKGNKIFVNGYAPHIGDGYKILRGEKEVGGAHIEAGNIVLDCDCKSGDELRLTSDGKLIDKLKSATRKLPVTVNAKIMAHDCPQVTVVCGNRTVVVNGNIEVQSAKTQALRDTEVVKCFQKVSDYPFVPDVNAECDGNPFMAISSLNELRRQAYDEMYRELINGYVRRDREQEYRGLNYNIFDGRGTILMVDDVNRLTEEILHNVDYIALNPRNYAEIEKPCRSVSKPILLNLPVVMRGDDETVITKAINSSYIYGVISNNLYSLKLTDKPILLGTGHNIIGDCKLPHVKSFESDRFGKNDWVYVFGYAPLMTLCHCIYGKCINCSGNDFMTDERGRKFMLRRFNSAHCYWQFLNYVPHCLNDSEYQNKFYDCTVVNTRDIIKILNGDYAGEHTKGNINKGLK